jgi:hypothetical protein
MVDFVVHRSVAAATIRLTPQPAPLMPAPLMPAPLMPAPLMPAPLPAPRLAPIMKLTS